MSEEKKKKNMNCVSRKVLDSLLGSVRMEFEHVGRRQMKGLFSDRRVMVSQVEARKQIHSSRPSLPRAEIDLAQAESSGWNRRNFLGGDEGMDELAAAESVVRMIFLRHHQQDDDQTVLPSLLPRYLRLPGDGSRVVSGVWGGG